MFLLLCVFTDSICGVLFSPGLCHVLDQYFSSGAYVFPQRIPRALDLEKALLCGFAFTSIRPLYSNVSLELMVTVLSRLGFSQPTQKLETQHSELFEVKPIVFVGFKHFFPLQKPGRSISSSFLSLCVAEWIFSSSPHPSI